MNKRTNIYFLGSKDIGYDCLKYLLQEKESLNIHIQGVLTNNRPSLLDKEKDIHSLIEKNNLNHIKSLNDLLLNKDVDFLISVQYHNILKKEHIQKAKVLAVNVHMAPLPEYRGCNQFSFAIIDKAKVFGTTFHVLEEGIDSGDILFENRFPISENLTVKELYEITYNKTLQLFKEHIKDIFLQNFKRTPQAGLIDTRGTSFHLRKEIDEIKKLDLNWSRSKIKRYFRATYFPPFNPPYAIVGDKKVDITPEWIAKNIDEK